jgi:hypothetical protein
VCVHLSAAFFFSNNKRKSGRLSNLLEHGLQAYWF